MAEHPAIEAANAYRARLLAKEATAAGRLVRSYGRIYGDIQRDIDALLAETWNPEQQAYKRFKLARLESFKKQIKTEIDKYGQYADQEMMNGAQDAIAQALPDARNLVQLSLSGALQEAGIMSQWNRLPTDSVETLLGFLGTESPLHDALTNKLGAAVADQVADVMVKGITLGWNPRKTAQMISKQFGAGLTWSMTTVRTAQIWSYREATRASYAANPKIVKGWTWMAALDARTCMSCVAQHGTHHPVSESLDDHHNGRCCMLPDTVTYRDLGYNVDESVTNLQPGDGEKWFKSLSKTEQRDMMGPGMYDAWNGGGFEFAKLSTTYQDAVYGQMRRQATLGELMGGGGTKENKLEQVKAWIQDSMVKPLEIPEGLPADKRDMYIEKLGPVKLGAVDADIVEPFARGFKAVMDEYNLPLLDGFEDINGGSASIAEFQLSEGRFGTVRLNSAVINKLKADGIDIHAWLKQSHESGWLSGDSLEDLGRHEAMHYAWYKNPKFAGYGKRDIIMSAYQEAHYSGAIKGISRYADTKVEEFFAETAVAVHNRGVEAVAGGNAKLLGLLREIFE